MMVPLLELWGDEVSINRRALAPTGGDGGRESVALWGSITKSGTVELRSQLPSNQLWFDGQAAGISHVIQRGVTHRDGTPPLTQTRRLLLYKCIRSFSRRGMWRGLTYFWLLVDVESRSEALALDGDVLRVRGVDVQLAGQHEGVVQDRCQD